MHLFTEYLQPLTLWINQNPSWALFITFLISFTESLAIIGSIIPGSVTMTAIGILAGSGVMRVDLTLVSAAFGAVAGDSASYYLGYKFRNTLPGVWPFSRYPAWLIYGKEYFAKHGGKSVLIGRFIGPLRSIIPVIAGMMHMNRWHFLAANIISAIGWSIVYVMPGVLIGAASTELSAESASRLFLLILLLLAIIWFITLAIKWMFKKIHYFLRPNLHYFWSWSRKHPTLAYYTKQLTPPNEQDYYKTVGLLLLFILCLVFVLLSTFILIQSAWATQLDESTYYFLQTLHTDYFVVFFIIISLFFKMSTLAALFTITLIFSVYNCDWRFVRYWLSLGISSLFISYLLASIIDVHTLTNSSQQLSAIYPSLTLTIATTLLGFLLFHMRSPHHLTVALTARLFLLSLLVLSGISMIYLGNYWLTSVLGAYLIGFNISLGHWIFFRRTYIANKRSYIPALLGCIIMSLATLASFSFNHKQLTKQYNMQQEYYQISYESWWKQRKTILPLYTTNRFGKQVGIFNIQFLGNINNLEKSLLSKGWRTEPPSFFYALLNPTNHGLKENFSSTAQLYKNKKPALLMVYPQNNNSPALALKLWKSNYYIQETQYPVWIGNIRPLLSYKKQENKDLSGTIQQPEALFYPLLSAIKNTDKRFVYLDSVHLNNLSSPPVYPAILLLYEQNIANHR